MSVRLKVTAKERFWFMMRYIMPKRSMAELSKPNGVFERFLNGECK
jgi:hypothetical protein